MSEREVIEAVAGMHGVSLDWERKYEEMVVAKERAQDHATVLAGRQRERHGLDVRWALEDLVRTLNRLEELDVNLTIDQIDLVDAVGDLGALATWKIGEVNHCADLVHEDEDGKWAIKEECG
jgi:hypothetical protein